MAIFHNSTKVSFMTPWNRKEFLINTWPKKKLLWPIVAIKSYEDTTERKRCYLGMRLKIFVFFIKLIWFNYSKQKLQSFLKNPSFVLLHLSKHDFHCWKELLYLCSLIPFRATMKFHLTTCMYEIGFLLIFWFHLEIKRSCMELGPTNEKRKSIYKKN